MSIEKLEKIRYIKYMLRKLFIFFMIIIPVFAIAQSREDILVHIPAVISSRPDQAVFIQEHFEVEVSAASYTLTPTAAQADFLIRLEVLPNMILYEDGWDYPPWDEPQYLLQLVLMNNETNTEMLSFQYPFTELFDIYLFSLEMTYAAMANVPLTRLGDIAMDDDRWRNQWLYIAMALNYPVVTAYGIQTPTIYRVQGGEITQTQNLQHMVIPNPGVTINVEVQFLNFMMAHLGFAIRFGDPMAQNQFIPVINLGLGFPIKPPNARHIKLVPFLQVGASANTANTSDVLSFPRFSVGGGLQLAIRASTRNAFFVDINYMHSLGNVITTNPLGTADGWQPDRISYNRWMVSIGFGFKIGFIDRNPPLTED